MEAIFLKGLERTLLGGLDLSCEVLGWEKKSEHTVLFKFPGVITSSTFKDDCMTEEVEVDARQEAGNTQLNV